MCCFSQWDAGNSNNLILSMLGEKILAYILKNFVIFPRILDRTFHKIWDNLYDMPKHIFWRKKQNKQKQ